MSRQKRAWVLLFLLIAAVFCCDLTVSATSAASEGPQSGTGKSSSPASSKPPASSSKKPVSSSGKPAASSRKPASSRRRTQVRRVVSSSPSSASSQVSSAVSLAPVSSEIQLPSIGSLPEDDPLDSVASDASAESGVNWMGIISWICIALAVAVVVIILLSNRRPPRGPGRSRYRRPKRSHKKHLLNEKYYRNIKY